MNNTAKGGDSLITWGFYSFKGNPEKCYEELKSLGEGYTPEDVLNLAEDPNTELHKCFTWDDTKAARLYRLHEARVICSSLKVTVERKEGVTQQYRVIQHDEGDRVYRPVIFTVRNEDRYERLLSQALKELESFKVRYAEIVELQSVIDEIEKVL